MAKSPSRKRRHWGLIVLSAIDLTTGILSLIFTALAVQVIALMASGVTLISAIKIAVQSEKAGVLVKPVAIYAVRALSRSEKMKIFFNKAKNSFKNNPVTIITSTIELAVCGGLGYILLDFFGRFSWAVGWKAYLAAFGAAVAIYAVLVVMTVYIGHDSEAFSKIRKFVKIIGGDEAVTVLEDASKEIIETLKAEEEKKAAEQAAEIEKAKKEAEVHEQEQKIYEFALQKEAERKAKEEERRRVELIQRYTAEYNRESQEVNNNVDPRNIQG